MSSVRNPFLLVCALLFILGSVAFGDGDPNLPMQNYSYSTFDTEPNSVCPSWVDGFTRHGSDGGNIVVKIDACQVYEYEHHIMPQGGGTGTTVNLQVNDIFIVWDENTGDETLKYFTYTDDACIAEDPTYIDVTAAAGTYFTIYRVTQSGTLTRTYSCCNEIDIIHITDGGFLWFWKVGNINDPNDCVTPGDELTYTIYWDNQSDFTYYDCWIIDYLPDGVTYPEGSWTLDPNNNFIPPDPGYNEPNHTYTWSISEIDDIEPGNSGSVQITVVVNENAEPSGILHNLAELWSDETLLLDDTEDTTVCCWEPDEGDPNIIYVDIDAPGANIGISWQNAYTDLQDALNRIAGGCSGKNPEIWVADGTYKPGNNPSDSFIIPDNVKVCGGFGGVGVYETSINQRNFQKYDSILSGYGVEVDGYNNTVVTMGNNSLLDGFTVEKSGKRGIEGSEVISTINNCVIRDNEERGVFYENGNLAIQWCKVFDNGFYGIHHNGTGYNLEVSNCKIHDNLYDGILTESSVPTIKNSLVFSNGSASTPNSSYYGINIRIPSSSPEIYNNTIVYNVNEGVNYFETDPNDTIEVYVRNNILWYNNDDGLQFSTNEPNHPESYNHNCTADADPNFARDDYDNLSGEPGFAYADDPNGMYNFHLAYDSPCIESGDNDVVDTGDVDMDNEEYIYGTTVDIGADEVHSCDDDLSEDDVYNELDWNADGIVNLYEYVSLSRAWESYDPNHHLCDPNDPDYEDDPNNPDYISDSDKLRFDARCDLNDDLTINLSDINLFASDWLWEACWRKSIRGSFEVAILMNEESAMMSVKTASMMVAPTVATKTTIPEARTAHSRGTYRRRANSHHWRYSNLP